MTTVAENETLKCYLCSRRYHHQCLNMTSATYRELNKSSWQCPSCDNVTKRFSRRGDETPTRKQFEEKPTAHASSVTLSPSYPAKDRPIASLAPTHQQKDQAVSYTQFVELLDTKLEGLRLSITKDFNNMLSELKVDFCKELESLRGENAKLKEDLAALEQRVQISDAAKMTEAIVDLQQQLQQRDQDLLSNDVEISGIPEHKVESVMHLTLAVALKLGMELEDRDIVSAMRVGPKSEPVEGVEPRPRPIVVRLTRRTLRDQLLKNARVRRGATTSDLGLPEHEPKKFYVNERLTKANRALFGKARDAGRTARWKYIWTSDGRVFGRKQKTSDRIVLRNEEDIKTFITD